MEQKTKLRDSILSRSLIKIFFVLILGFIFMFRICNIQIEKKIVQIINSQNAAKGELVSHDLSKNNIDTLEKIISNKYTEKEYLSLVEKLKNIKESHDYSYVYLIYKDGNNYKYLIDADYKNLNNEPYSSLGDKVEELESIPLVYEDKESKLNSTISHDIAWGDTITSYIPILDKDEEVIAVLGIDSNASIVDELSSHISLSIFKSSLTLFIIFSLTIYIILKNITKEISVIGKYINELSNNKLNSTFSSFGNDEVGILHKNLFNSINNIKNIILDTKNVAKTTHSSSVETKQSMNEFASSYAFIENTMSDTTDRIESITANSQEIVGNTEEISSQISLITESFNNLQNNINEILQANNDGSKAVCELNETISLTQEHIKDTVISKIHYISNNMKDILPVISSIKNISEQINLLALNASIEAARAGKHGAGFAVVAEEVRKLSIQTDSITRNIISNIESLNAEILTTQKYTELVENNLLDQQNKVDFVDSSFKEIDKNISDFNNVFNSFSSQLNSVNTSKDALLSAIESIAASVEETNIATGEVLNTIKSKKDDILEITNKLSNLEKDADTLTNKLNMFKI